LPTEAEWEYAAKGGARALFAGVDDYKQVCEVGNVGDLGATTRFDWGSSWSKQCTDLHVGLAPVGSYRGNGYGLHDMTGNVWEWCWDRYGAYGGTSVDPVGAQSGADRVFRGGSWGNGPRFARVADRNRRTPGGRSADLGLRLLRTIP
jgi:formylglycine-generating enzyme required for sulfatase activity